MEEKKVNKICQKCFYACKQKSKIEITSCSNFRSNDSVSFIENLDKSIIKTLESVPESEDNE